MTLPPDGGLLLLLVALSECACVRRRVHSKHLACEPCVFVCSDCFCERINPDIRTFVFVDEAAVAATQPRRGPYVYEWWGPSSSFPSDDRFAPHAYLLLLLT